MGWWSLKVLACSSVMKEVGVVRAPREARAGSGGGRECSTCPSQMPAPSPSQPELSIPSQLEDMIHDFAEDPLFFQYGPESQQRGVERFLGELGMGW